MLSIAPKNKKNIYIYIYIDLHDFLKIIFHQKNIYLIKFMILRALPKQKTKTKILNLHLLLFFNQVICLNFVCISFI